MLICIASHRFINWIKDAGFWETRKLENHPGRGLQEIKEIRIYSTVVGALVHDDK